MKRDLHSHTHHSDGSLSPRELVIRAHNQQLDQLAITDHDTVAGLGEAYAQQELQPRPLTIIPGIELSVGWRGFDIHIVGLNIRWRDPQLAERIHLQQQARLQRAQQIAEKLTLLGLPNSYDHARKLAGKGQITRAHFARALVANGHVASFEMAFRRYLGKGKRAHVVPQWITLEQAVTWITAANGVAVLAHPSRYGLTGKWLRRLLVQFKAAGGQAMEVVYPNLSPSWRQQLLSYASEYDLLASAGSDFHRPNRWSELGRHLSLPLDLIPVWRAWE